MKYFLFILIFLCGCAAYSPKDTYEVRTIEEHEYVVYYTEYGITMCHSENCKNPIHKKKIKAFLNKYEKSI
jgi:hypothetical protein